MLDYAGIFADTAAVATQDFNVIRRQRPRIQNAVWHATLSFAYADEVNSAMMTGIAGKYLSELGLAKNQYLVVRHHDTQHEHLHIVANRVGFTGEVVSDKWCKNRTAKACDRLEKEFNLTVARDQGRGKVVASDKIPALKQVKQEIKVAILECLMNRVSNMDRLKSVLQKKGIETHLQVQKTGRVNGITFRKNQIAIKGSAVDRNFSYQKLKNKLTRGRDQGMSF